MSLSDARQLLALPTDYEEKQLAAAWETFEASKSHPSRGGDEAFYKQMKQAYKILAANLASQYRVSSAAIGFEASGIKNPSLPR